MGYGVSNKAALKFLALNENGNYFVSNNSALSDEDKLFLENNSIEYEENGNTYELLNCEKIVVSPGVIPVNPILIAAADKGIKILIDLDLIENHIDPKIKKIGVTGTNGKTTTVELTTTVLSSEYKAVSTGNIGVSPAEIAENDLDFMVYELSSYQLHYLNNVRFDFGALLNVTEDHLSWHGGMKDYFESKMRLSKFSKYFAYNSDLLDIFPADNFLTVDSSNEKSTCKIDFKKKYFRIRNNGETYSVNYSGLKLLGKHNVYNAAFASLIGIYSGISPENIENSLMNFEPEEHRMEVFANYKNTVFINDSKSTNADSLINAVNTFSSRGETVVLLCGGVGKGEDYSCLAETISNKVLKTYICGDNSLKMKDFLENRCDYEIFESWDILIKKLFSELKENITVLFSPGGASFDHFKNYKERGEYFKNRIGKILESL